MDEYHVPVLLKETVGYLITDKRGVYADLTAGSFGHSREILLHLEDEARLFSFDQDAEAGGNQLADERVTFINANFRFLSRFLKMHGIEKIHGITADLGISSHQLEEPSYGISMRNLEGPLDMRMSKKAELTAEIILNSYPEEKLADLFFQYGELRGSRKLARQVVDFRKDKPLRLVGDLIAAVDPVLNGRNRNRELAQLSQSIRIEVNGELDALKEVLEQSVDLLHPGGRLTVLSYHSLEDRLVKNFIRSGTFDGNVETDLFGRSEVPFKRVVTKAIKPSDTEVRRNPRSRSARLRIGERKAN